MKQTIRLFLFFIFLANYSYSYAADEVWDVLDKSMSAWNQDGATDNAKAWKVSKTYLTATQASGYVNIAKTSGADGFLIPSSYPSTDKSESYTFDLKAKVNATGKVDTESVFEANQIAISIGGKKIRVYLKYGDADNGYLCYTPAATHDDDEKYVMNTSEWHVYRFVYNPADFTYDIYVDSWEKPIAKGIKTHYDGTKNAVTIGADKDQYCNMDIEYVKFGKGNFALKTQLRNLEVSSDSHVVGNSRSITATVNTDLVADGQKISLALYNTSGAEAVSPIDMTVSGNKASAQFSIPSSLSKGKYVLKAFVENGKIGAQSVDSVAKDYFIVDKSPITSKILPQVKTENFEFVIKMEDYTFQPPTKEFIFPSIIDSKEHIGIDGKFLDGGEPLGRYYWFHAPHDDPGGIYLYTSNSLDGPWTEQNMILSNDWAKAQGINTSHISSSHVLWNSVANKYFMYFHGNNDRTHYATSDNMKDWTYGAQVVQYDDFSFSSREASYARVFEHEVPGYNNKFVMFLMINENNYRTIYWAHSLDGIKWKAVREPLVSPRLGYKKIPGTDTRPTYQNNVSGPNFMEVDGRCFVFFHSTAGNISVVEIGKGFDMEVHWGEYLKKSEVVISEDENGALQAVSRVASPFFIKDDEGAWHLFIEAGHRLGANTAHTKGEAQGTNLQETRNSEDVFNISYTDEGFVLHNKTEKTGSFYLVDLTGKPIKKGILATGENAINIDKGVYITSISIGDTVASVKIMK